MGKPRLNLVALLLALSLTSACALPLYTQPTPVPIPTMAPLSTPIVSSPAATTIPITPNLPTAVLPSALPPPALPQAPSAQIAPANFCADAQARALITNFKVALQSANGPSLAALVSPVHGMDVRYYRNGRMVNYDQLHAKFLFGSTYQVDWGMAAGSGRVTKGSFHEVVLPSLLNLFNKNYTLVCNQIQVGGTTYQAVWPYPGINFYSAYFPGTQANGNLDWHTALIGMEYIGGQPYLYALTQFQWEP